MFKCHVCGSTEGRQELVDEVFQIEGEFVMVEGIPATVCVRCGETIFSREATERVRRLVREQRIPLKSVQVNVFAYT